MADKALLRLNQPSGIPEATGVVCDNSNNLSGLGNLVPATSTKEIGSTSLRWAAAHMALDAKIQWGVTDTSYIQGNGGAGVNTLTLQGSASINLRSGRQSIQKSDGTEWGYFNGTFQTLYLSALSASNNAIDVTQGRINLASGNAITWNGGIARGIYADSAGDLFLRSDGSVRIYYSSSARSYFASDGSLYITAAIANRGLHLSSRARLRAPGTLIDSNIELISGGNVIFSPARSATAYRQVGIEYRDFTTESTIYSCDVVPGCWRAAILCAEQLVIFSNVGQVAQAQPLYWTADLTSGGIIYITDGTTTRGYGANSGGDRQFVVVAGDPAATMQNFAAAVTGDPSGLWNAVYKSTRLGVNSSTYGFVVVYRRSQGAYSHADRIYKSSGMTAYIYTVPFGSDYYDYRKAFDGTSFDTTIGTSDPGEKRFGPGWRAAYLAEGDMFLALAEQSVYMLNKQPTPDEWTGVGAGLALPGSSTNTAIVRWKGTSGRAIMNSSVLVDDSGNLAALGNVLPVSGGTKALGSESLWWGAAYTGEVRGREVSAPGAAHASYGIWWVKDDSPNTPMFTDDNGTSFSLLGGATQAVSRSGTGGAVSVNRNTRYLKATLNNSANVTWNLPTAASMTGVLVALRHDGDGTGTCTIDPDGSETIDGAATKTVSPATCMFVWSTGTEWFSLTAI